MRRWLPVAVAVFGAFVIVLACALFNLGTIIGSNRAYLLARASAALGRSVAVSDFRIHLGWPIAIDLSNLKIGEDPAFGSQPFLQANEVLVEVSLLPLLTRRLELTRIRILEPAVHVIRTRSGRFNMATLGAHDAGNQIPSPTVLAAPAADGARVTSAAQLQLPGANHPGRTLPMLTITSLRIENGTLTYVDEQLGGSPLNIERFDMTFSDFRADSSARLEAALGTLGVRQNVTVAGEVGPLIRGGRIALPIAPLDLTARVGPFSMDQLRTLSVLGPRLPPGLSVSAPITIAARIGGTFGAPDLIAHSDLSPSRVVYGGVIDKAAGSSFKVSVEATRNTGRLAVKQMTIATAGFSVSGTDISFGPNRVAARLDADQVDLAQVGKVLTPVRDYQLSGHASLHANVALVARRPSATGSMVLVEVNVTPPGGRLPAIREVSGAVQMSGNTAKVGPWVGDIGSSRATLSAEVGSLEPFRATYRLTTDSLRPAEFLPHRGPMGEQMTQVAAAGSLSQEATGAAASTRLTSFSGTLANVAYQNLALNASYRAGEVTIDSLNAAAFGGALEASGSATLGGASRLALKFGAQNIDSEKALESQKARATRTIRGRLSGDLVISGAGATFDQMRPTLHGSGQGSVANGKLVGFNMVAQALNKVNDLPGIGALVPGTVVARHPELFSSPDTAIDQANLTFTVQGPRLTSHDIDVRTADYEILGDGWFELDKRLDLSARILLSPAFSRELVSARRNVAYLENSARQIEIPLRITGRLPKPSVVPDIRVLVERATTNAIEGRLGRWLGGSSSGGGPSLPKNPLDELRRLFR